MFILSKKVRESNIKVVITGEGADEMLAGYNIFKEAKIRRFWAKEPESSSRPRLLSQLYPYLPMMKESKNTALRMFFGFKLTETNDPLYSHLLRWHNTSRIRTYFSKSFTADLANYNPVSNVYSSLPSDFMNYSDLAKSQYLESSIFMSGYLLSSQGDRMAMGNSVEGRYPFLDYRLIEFCAKLPDRFKLNCLNEKFILKKMSFGKIPESITKRSKQAYRAPIASSFFSPNSPTYINDILSNDIINEYGIFDAEKVQSLIGKIKKSTIVSEMDQMAIAGILSTQLLYKLFIKNKLNPDIKLLAKMKIVND
jgi:asparagine synthase (glutamine-hydrolysing)